MLQHLIDRIENAPPRDGEGVKFHHFRPHPHGGATASVRRGLIDYAANKTTDGSGLRPLDRLRMTF